MSPGKPFGRASWSQPLADVVAPCLAPSLARFGFSEADLLMFWPEIVGERLAARCEPVRMQWPPRAPARAAVEPATLVVRVEGGFAVELQHQAAQVVERVNTHFGWRCVGRLALRQGPVEQRRAARTAPPPPDSASVRQAERVVGDIVDDGLRAALVRLGSRAIRPV